MGLCCGRVATRFSVLALIAGVLPTAAFGVAWGYTGILDIVYKGVPRAYHALFPHEYAIHSTQVFPAIIFLHGNGADAAAFALETNMTQEAPARGYILLFPEGVQTPNSTLRCRERSWNAGSCCDEAYLNQVDDVAFLAAVIAHMAHQAQLRVDFSRLFVAGSSNGGSMALRAACELPERFAGVVGEIPSFEQRDGAVCASDRCSDGGDGYWYCDWDANKPGCARDEWGSMLPSVYSCDTRAHPVPTLLLNGRLDPLSNVSGQISKPQNSSMEHGYVTSFPAMEWVYEYLAAQYCDDPRFESAKLTFENGTAGNSSACFSSPKSCVANVTLCFSDAGHRWYGDSYNRDAVCRWEGYKEADCNQTADLIDYGPNTQSLHATTATLDFFDRIQKPNN